MNMGVRLGADPKTLAGIINTSSGRCWSSDTYNPVPGVMPGTPASNDYQPGFMAQLMLKDLGLAMENSLKTQSAVPMGALARSLYASFAGKGNSQRDFSAIIEMMQGE